MKRIGGNIVAQVQIKKALKNSIGEIIEKYETVKTIRGFLDFMSGEYKIGSFNAKIEESTHIFICDNQELPAEYESRLLIHGKPYEIKLIDNPMELGRQIEIYLKFVG